MGTFFRKPAGSSNSAITLSAEAATDAIAIPQPTNNDLAEQYFIVINSQE
tara:strand:- start:689 stop:838 length:150 start_codon:yes stop_codon:yes gene_type:complete